MLLWDCDNREYSYYIEVSTDQKEWTLVVDKRKENCKLVVNGYTSNNNKKKKAIIRRSYIPTKNIMTKNILVP